MTVRPGVPDGGRQPVPAIDLTLLLKWSRSRALAARVVLRSRIVLKLADGCSVRAIAAALGIAPSTVRLWKRRYDDSGPDGLLHDAPGRGRKPVLDLAARRALRTGTGAGDPSTVRSRAKELGVSPATVSRWQRRTDIF